MLIKNYKNILFFLLLIIFSFSMFYPYSPRMPGYGLDQSWIYAVNEAVAKGMLFGKQIIFTFGPLASIYTKAYHPDIFLLTTIISTYFCIFFLFSIYYLTLNLKKWKTIFFFFLLSIFCNEDALFLSIPLLIVLNILSLETLEAKYELKNLSISKKDILSFLNFSALGILPLIKGTMLLGCISTLFISIFFIIYKKQYKNLFIGIVSPIITGLLLWLITGQKIENIFAYFFSMIPIISGYGEAMAKSGSIVEEFFFVLLSTSLIFSIFTNKNIILLNRIWLSLSLSIYLFISFKAGYVRHDGHGYIAIYSLFLSYVLIYFYFSKFEVNSKFFRKIFIINAIFFSTLYLKYGITDSIIKTEIQRKNISLQDIKYLKVSEKISLAFNTFTKNELVKIVFDSFSLKNNWFYFKYPALSYKNQFEIANLEINKICNIKYDLNGTTDIYSFDTACLIAKNLNWHPRPIFQSYSAYTHELSNTNIDHIHSDKRPDNIIFKIQTIDGRLPSLDDGASWPDIFLNYEIKNKDENQLYLHKTNKNLQNPKFRLLSKENVKYGEKFHLPNNNKLFAKIFIEPTLIGKIQSLLYKTDPVEIKFSFSDGSEKIFKIIPKMSNSRFLISPIIETTSQFSKLISSEKLDFQTKPISIELIKKNGLISNWNDNFVVQLEELME